MSQMHQMQLTYVAEEDRMLFRVNTKERQEFRFWMTRRYTAILWHALTQMLANRGSAAGTPMADPLAAAAQQEVLQQQAVAQADFETGYQESGYLPLGETPSLLYSVGIKPAPNGQPLLCLHPLAGQGIEIALDEPITRSLCQLILETVAKAEWGLSLAFVSGSGPSSEGAKGWN